MTNLKIICGDITELAVDGLVLPAHKHYSRGQGLSAQIFDLAGPDLVSACNDLGKSHTGDARCTPAPNLKAQYLIHTVTPLWSSGDFGGASSMEQLECCYNNTLRLAREQNIKRIAFPALGAGSNKTPHSIAAHIGLNILHEQHDHFDEIIICLNSEFARIAWTECYDVHIEHNQVA
ncbi:hypothetical protein A9Q99_08010 [Gammaproteobacteria bacterium 45_16_T64]|nr:hypothetical protein A9Q99_08010 [Gammaproteobacteria bacterium 45_16_T64]